eukprot:gene13937-16205_t
MATQRDLSLAYSPGVAVPVRAIAANPDAAYDYTSKGNLVAVISNGTAILGLGDLGALASKPVMEGKSVLFKRFADVDSIDIEISARDPDEIITVVKNIGVTFGGINLEDIKSPECFRIETELQELLDIPVFHDDQHGTAIISAAGLINACHITGRDISKIKVALNGPGAAGIATLELIKAMIKTEDDGEELLTNYNLCDTIYAKAKVDLSAGVVYLWIGASTMVEYTYAEALDLLEKQLEQTHLKINELQEDLYYIRGNAITVEVNMARLFNHSVKQRKIREAAAAAAGEATATAAAVAK